MPKLRPEQWREIDPYLDQALSLPENERAAWLASFRENNPPLGDLLQTLLDEHRALAQSSFLEGPPVSNAAATSVQGQQIGAYKLISPIGQGGMGIVWLAERSDGRFERRVAVKFLRFSVESQGGVERFKREGAILGRLSHPNIAELLDAGVTAAGDPYFVLEYVEGEPIDTYCDQRKLDLRARVHLFLDVLGAVAHAHGNLIIHRDIKPSNVLVSKNDAVKLLDFGIAKLLEGEGQLGAATLLTHEAGSAFTPAFAAPEQLTGKTVTMATDVYALGGLLYVLLTGKLPIGTGVHSPADLVKAIVETEPPRASSTVQSEDGDSVAEKRSTTAERLRRQLRGDLDAIVHKALHKESRVRYASAYAFAEDLRRYLAREPVMAQPDSTWYRAKKFASRRRWAAAAIASVLLALTLGLSAALWQAHKATRETRVAAAMEKFLEEIFRANSSYQEDPVKARQTTARELLDIGARKIDGELSDAPEARLRILKTLGGMYHDLGLDDQAVSMHRKAVTLARTRYGNDSREVAFVLIDLAGALHASRSVSEEEAVLLEAKQILDRQRDLNSPQRGNLLVMLAQHYQSSNLQSALDYSRQAVAVYRHYPSDPYLAEALYEEASVLSLLDQPRQAELLLGEAIRVSVKLPGDVNPMLPRFYAYQGEAQQKLMEFAAAEESLRHALLAARKVNGDDHVDTLETELRLGIFLCATSRTGEGKEHIERARAILLRTRSADDPFFAPQVFLEYGRVLAMSGRLEEGLVYISKAVENRRRNRPGTRYLAQMLELQASVLIDLGRYAEAQRLLDEAKVISRKVNSLTTFIAVDGQARLMIATGRADQADLVLDSFHPAVPAAGALAVDALHLLTSRAAVALARGDSETAARLATQVIQEISASTARDYLKALEARAALVEGRAELLRGQPSGALPVLQRAVALQETILDPASPVLADARIALADSYLSLGDSKQAIALTAAAKKALASHHELSSQYMWPLQNLEERLRHHSPLQRHG